MMEQEKPPAMGESERASARIAAIARVLRTAPEGVVDAELGEGVRFRVGQGSKERSLEIYPGPGYARVVSRDIRVQLSDLAPPEIFRNGVALGTKTDEAQLWFTSRGAVTFTIPVAKEDSAGP